MLRYILLAVGLAAVVAGAAVMLLPVNVPLIGMLFGSSITFDQEDALRARLRLADGWAFNLYAVGLGDARLMQLAGDGSIVISDTDGGKVYRVAPDADGDGRADSTTTLLKGLNRPHGLLLEGETLYIAEENRLVQVTLDLDDWTATRPEIVLPDIPADGGHSSRTVARGPDGQIYLTVGSSCNVCKETHPWRAAMIRVRADGSEAELFASGLRNTVGFDWHPRTGALYGVDNARDWLGDDFPPDELNLIERGAFYGWPWYNGANIPDPDLGDDRPVDLSEPTAPVYGFPAHVSPLSIRFLRHQKAGPLRDAALVALHGSWNRSKKIGYQVVALTWAEDGKITSRPFMTGFLEGENVIGRPVDIVEANDGTVYVSDDFAGAIYRLRRTGG